MWGGTLLLPGCSLVQPDAAEVSAPDGEVGGGAYLLAYTEAGGYEGVEGRALGCCLGAVGLGVCGHDMECGGAYAQLGDGLDGRLGVGEDAVEGG